MTGQYARIVLEDKKIVAADWLPLAAADSRQRSNRSARADYVVLAGRAGRLMFLLHHLPRDAHRRWLLLTINEVSLEACFAKLQTTTLAPAPRLRKTLVDAVVLDTFMIMYLKISKLQPSVHRFVSLPQTSIKFVF
ncbi:hypothetical protein EVAR_98228_1 [Eumeta japonica]|uniref:Uncharacterized protein n=1 Tax=Eumeta variegata TaxID=151549 RepID=A0A4C2A8P0_EUMVA|nr:hypothetical protein EVAR_98228_1 [Eumeta japonica]